MVCRKLEHVVQKTYPKLEGILEVQYYISPTSSWLTDDAVFQVLKDSPLDGIFFSADTNTGLNFGETIFAPATYTMADVSNVLANILERNERGWGKCVHNWLNILTEPVQIDFKNPVHTTRLYDNWMVAGELVFRSKENCGPGLRGIAFDNENYGSPGKWQYSTSAQAGSYTLAQYNDATYDSGYQIGLGLKGIDPNFEIFFYNGYFLYWAYLQNNGDTQPFRETNPYGLLRPFMDGIYDAFGERYTGGVPNCIVGNQSTYSCQTQLCVDQMMILDTGENPYNVSTPYADIWRFKGQSIYYDTLTSFAPGLWLSYAESNVPVYDNNSPLTNYFTPDGVIQSFQYMAPYAKFLFIFQQHAAFYLPLPSSPPGVELVNGAYTEALHEWRSLIGLPP